MASVTVPIQHTTLKGRFGDFDWEVWPVDENRDDPEVQWGFSLSWGTPNASGEYEAPDLYADPVLARGTAFALIARWENEEIKTSDLASYCQHMEDSQRYEEPEPEMPHDELQRDYAEEDYNRQLMETGDL